MVDRHRSLLAAAARLYERYGTIRSNPFNVFSVLRSPTDEMNLHSRFLHALLVVQDPLSGRQENLKEFVRKVIKKTDFDVGTARVQRESNYIDLLISNDRQAILIENKIRAGDQPQQLQRYQEVLVTQKYDMESITLVYLTPYGHRPSEQSAGEIPVEQIQRVSYRDDLREWLLGCQRRAFDDPGLRESIAQYLRLILAMTNNNFEMGHMRELKELLRQGDNVVLASQISKSLVDVTAELVKDFYSIVDSELHNAIRGLPKVDPEWIDSMGVDEIKKCVRGRGRARQCGLNYKFAKHAWLYVGGTDRLWCGVVCSMDENVVLHNKCKEILPIVAGVHESDDSTPWYRWMDDLPAWNNGGKQLDICEPDEPTLTFLSSGEDSLKEYARGVADVVGRLWKAVKHHKLVTAV